VDQQPVSRPARRTMRRRDLVALLGAAAVAAPWRAAAQQRGGVRRLGVLMGGVLAEDPEGQAWAAALIEGLGALDWHEGGNLTIDWRWAGGDPALFERHAAELVALAPEVLVCSASPAVAALRRRTTTLPIIFAVVVEPVVQGFIESLARPGGNITGFSAYDPPMAGKWLAMLTQLDPPVARVAVLHNPATTPYATSMQRTIEEAARSLALTVRSAPVRDDAEIEATMVGLAHEERGGLLVLPSAFTVTHRDAIVGAAARHRVPAVYPFREFATSGGLMFYGVNHPDLFRRSASYVDRILKGEKPADLPVQAPTKFELIVNLKTAAALGITVMPSLIGSADHVIE
jgi:putative ABC transport system substrate-binding protein